ncbi:mucin-2-like [Tigriopus californicus]|uniref:mucin-2-like n=1 Tax=Tigriopus californicus TaxID=6832 RepID=UPI0027DA700E|nr:mucin-2-like [Tigriopus californicus]
MWGARIFLLVLSLMVLESEGLFFNLFKKNRGVPTRRPSYYPGNSNNVKPSYSPPVGQWRPIQQNQIQPSYHPPKGNSFSKSKRKFKWDILGIFGSKKPTSSGYRPAYKPLYNYNTPGHRPGRPQGGYGPPSQGTKPGYAPPSQGTKPGYRPPSQGTKPGYQPPSQGTNTGYQPPSQGTNTGYQPSCQTTKPGYLPPPGRPQTPGNFHQGNRPSYPQQPVGTTRPQNGYLPPNTNPGTHFPTFPTQAPPVIFPSDDGYGSPQASVIGQQSNLGIFQNNNNNNDNNNIGGSSGISQPASTGYGSPQAPVLGLEFPTQSFLPPNQGFSVPTNVPSTFNPPLTSNTNPSSQTTTGVFLTQSNNNGVDQSQAPSLAAPTQPSTRQPDTGYGSPLGSVIASDDFGSSVITPELALDANDGGALPLGSIANSINNPPSQTLALETPLIVEALRNNDAEGGEPLAELSSFGDEWIPMTMAKIMEMFSLPQKSDAQTSTKENLAQSRANQSGPQVVLVQDTVRNPFTQSSEKQVTKGRNNLSQVIVKVNKEEIEDVATLEPPYSAKEVRQTATTSYTSTTTIPATLEVELLIVEDVTLEDEEQKPDPPPTPSPMVGTTTWVVGENKTIVEPTPGNPEEPETEVPLLEVQIEEEEELNARDGKSIDPDRIGLLPDMTNLDNSHERNAIHDTENEIQNLRESLNKVPYSATAMSPTASPTPSSLNAFVSLALDEAIPREETTPTSKQEHPKSILEILHVIDQEPFERDNFVREHDHDLDFSTLQDPEMPTIDYEYYTDFADHPNDEALDPATISDNAFFNVLREDNNDKWVWADRDTSTKHEPKPTTTVSTTSATVMATTTTTTTTTTTSTTTTATTKITIATTTTTTKTTVVTTNTISTTTVATTTTIKPTSIVSSSSSTPSSSITTSESNSSENSVSPTEAVDESPTLIPMTDSPVIWVSDPAEDFGEETNSIPDEKNSLTRSLQAQIQSTSEVLPSLVEEREEENVIDSKPNLLVDGQKNSAPLVWYYPIHGKPFRSFIPSVKYSSISG